MITLLADTFSEQFQELHRTLFGVRGSSGPTSVQFCSCHFSEGVTTTVLAFALCLARSYGHDSVIAIDANLRKPSFNEFLKIKPANDLLDVLTGRVPVERAIERSDSLGFSVISAGAEPKAGQRISAEPMLDNLAPVVTALKKHYRYVLVDSAPVVQFIDATIIAGAVDKVVLLVEAKVTRSEVVDRSIQKLKSGGAEISGIVLTKREFYIPKWLYRFI